MTLKKAFTNHKIASLSCFAINQITAVCASLRSLYKQRKCLPKQIHIDTGRSSFVFARARKYLNL